MRKFFLLFFLLCSPAFASDQRAAHLFAMKNLLCSANSFKPTLVCIGAKNISNMFSFSGQLKRAYIANSTTKFRIQVYIMDRTMSRYEQIINNNYKYKIGSVESIISDSRAERDCLSEYDPRNSANALRAISCDYPMPARFDFEAWTRSVSKGLDGGFLFPRVLEIHKKYQSSICAKINWGFYNGNRLTSFIPTQPKQISDQDEHKSQYAIYDFESLKRQYFQYSDDVQFMANTLNGDCDKYW